MNQDEKTEIISPELEQYISLCKRMFERMERENSWPWEPYSESCNKRSRNILKDIKSGNIISDED